MTNAKPFLIYSAYRPLNVHSDWIDLFEEKLSLAQTTGLEFILMGDFKIDINSCMNSKWSHLVQLFDLTQLITEPTRVTHTSSTLIDHVYTTTLAIIAESFVSQISLSVQFPVCFTRKMNRKLSKNQPLPIVALNTSMKNILGRTIHWSAIISGWPTAHRWWFCHMVHNYPK